MNEGGTSTLRMLAVALLAGLFVFGLGIGLNLLNIGGHVIWQVATPGTVNSVALSSDGSYAAAGIQTGNSGGMVDLIGKNGSVLWSLTVDRAIASVGISSDGQSVVAGGWQIAPGPAGAYTAGRIYMLGQGGSLLWNYSTGTDPVFHVVISRNGAFVAADCGSGVLYFNSTGSLLWQHSVGVGDVAMSADGARIVASTFDGALYAFGRAGDILWNRNFTGTLESVAVSSDGRYEAVGPGPNGNSATFFLLDENGSNVWRRDLNSLLLSAAISSDDSHVTIGTNSGALNFDSQGDLQWNVSLDGPSLVAISSDASKSFLGLWSGNPMLSVFSATGTMSWSYGTSQAHEVAVSADGSALAVAAGPSDTGPFTSSSGAVFLFNT
jgi:hypothetical protein